MSPPPDHIVDPSDPAPDTVPFNRPLREGQLVAGRYRVQEMVARGGQALIYRAEQQTLQRTVALKVIGLAVDSLEPEHGRFQDRFELEARTLAALDHPHIVRVHDFGPIGQTAFYFAMEYIQGASMSRVLRNETISRGEALRLMQEVMSALHYAHGRGVIHRDMKFSNVLISRDGHGQRSAKVIDFGIAKVSDTGEAITQRGDVLGSPHFMSPEQISGDPLDHRTDVYSVGIMLYKIVGGAYPFRGDNPQLILAGHLMRDPAPFSEIAPESDIPDELEAIIRRCLKKKASERFEDISELSRALAPFVEDACPVNLQVPAEGDEGTGGSASHTLAHGEGITPTRGGPGPAVLVGGLLVLFLAVVGIGGTLAWQSLQDSSSKRRSSDDDREAEVDDARPRDSTQGVETAPESTRIDRPPSDLPDTPESELPKTKEDPSNDPPPTPEPREEESTVRSPPPVTVPVETSSTPRADPPPSTAETPPESRSDWEVKMDEIQDPWEDESP